jgi:anti-sigma regulatory factor (Ser/Thr protein kinase)
MTTERPRIECALQDDARLFAGVRAIVFHSAEQVGLPEQTQEELAAATLEVCREAFAIAHKGGRRDAAIRLIVGGAADRIEITIDYPGDALRSRADDSAGKACAANGGLDRFGGVDHVRCENRGGRSRVTLIKQCGAVKSKSGD